MRRFRQWIHGKEKNKEKKKNDVPPEPPLPYLPAPASGASTRATWEPMQQTGSWFRLPTEIRLKILKEAFGNRTIHIDLRLLQPLRTHRWPSDAHPLHGGFPPRMQSWVPRPASGQKAWEWYSCLCHRNVPGESTVKPHQDRCLRGDGTCKLWPGTHPDKCRVGAMGLLLSCKKAHDELLDVLCSTNTIFIESDPLIDVLLRQNQPGAPRLMGPGMSLVTSIEMRWYLALFGDHGRATREADCREKFSEMLNLLPNAFPKLTRLHLVFEDGLYFHEIRPSQNMKEIENVLLNPLLAVAEMMRLDSFVVEVPEVLFRDLRTIVPPTPDEDAEALMGMGVFEQPMWYPFEGSREHGQPGKGYWIHHGVHSDLFWDADGRPSLISAMPVCMAF